VDSIVDLTYGRERTPLIHQALSLGMTAIEVWKCCSSRCFDSFA